jgi:hypothetical protein
LNVDPSPLRSEKLGQFRRAKDKNPFHIAFHEELSHDWLTQNGISNSIVTESTLTAFFKTVFMNPAPIRILDLFVDKSERRFPGHRVIGSRGASSGISATSGGNRSRNCLSSDSANYVRPKLKRERNIGTGMKVKIRFRGDGFSGHHKSQQADLALRAWGVPAHP